MVHPFPLSSGRGRPLAILLLACLSSSPGFAGQPRPAQDLSRADDAILSEAASREARLIRAERTVSYLGEIWEAHLREAGGTP